MVILIVDDSKLNLNIAQDILVKNYIQCDILLADSGEQCLKILESKHVDIILLDIVMPGLSGIDVLEKIKSNNKYRNINVIMLTSLTNRDVLKHCFEYGANDFINKPIETTEFIARIKASIREVNYKISLEHAFNIVSVQNEKLIQTNKTLKETQFYITQKEKIVAVGQLAAGVAHELNTPLGYVSSNFEVLKKDVYKLKGMIKLYRNLITTIDKMDINDQTIKDIIIALKEAEKKSHVDFIMDDLDELVDESKNGVDKAANIVRILRNFADSEAEDSINYNDINDVIEEVLLITNNEFKNIISVERRLEELPKVMCSRRSISQVIVNVISNSIQAIKESDNNEKGKIIIETKKDDKHIICSISDNGKGIPLDIINRIFDPFFTTKEVGEGTGLGLSVAYDIIVNKHKGEILVENINPSGAIFTIKIPFTEQ